VKKKITKKVVKKMVIRNSNTNRMVEISTDMGVMKVLLYNETPNHRDNFIKLVEQHFYDSLLFHRIIKGFMVQGGDPSSKNADSSAMLGGGDVGYKIPAEIVNGIWHKRGALAAARDNNPEKANSGCQFYIVDGQKFKRDQLTNMMNKKNLNRTQKVFYDLIQKDSINSTINAFQTAKDKDGLTKFIETLKPSVEELYLKSGGDYIYEESQVETYENIGGAPHLDGDYTVFCFFFEGFEVLDKIASVSKGQSDRPLQNIRMKMRMLN
jgi:cyclophilin family peptidyl-prolyl cis-trans isomerase